MTATRHRCGRDDGRAAVLEAEEAAYGGTDADDRLPWPQVAAHCRAVTGGAWWAAAEAPRVDLRAATDRARASSATLGVKRGVVVVRISDEQRTVATLAHELAHALAGVETGHGDVFRAAHLDLVAVLAGEPLARHLRAAYSEFGLVIGERTWPTPTVAAGDGFVWRAHG